MSSLAKKNVWPVLSAIFKENKKTFVLRKYESFFVIEICNR